MEETQQQFSRILTEFFDRMSSWEQGLVEGSGISLPQMHVLETLGNHRKLRMKELAEKLGVTTGTLTVMVQRLLQKDLIRRIRDEQDRRSSFIDLSPLGEEIYKRHHSLHDELIGELVIRLGDRESELFFASMEKVIEVL